MFQGTEEEEEEIPFFSPSILMSRASSARGQACVFSDASEAAIANNIF